MKRLTLAAVTACVLALAGCGSTALYGGRTHASSFLQSAQHAPSALARGLTVSPVILGFDAVTIGNIPSSAAVVGCYADGAYSNCNEARARFPHAHILSFAVNAGGVARMLDTEPGDAVPSQDPGFVRHMIALHIYDPGVYADSSEMPAVEQDLQSAGIPRSDYVLMVADWDGNPTIPAGINAKQYRSTSTVDYDSFSTAFFGTPAPKLVCFGKHPDVGNATCKKEIALYKTYQKAYTNAAGAVKSSQAVYDARSCQVLAQRESYFTALLKNDKRYKLAYRRGALAASKAAYKSRNCSEFASRIGYWTGQEKLYRAKENAALKEYA
jgi:hypothetical protein